MVQARAAMHENEWISLSDDFHEEGDVSNLHVCHFLLSSKWCTKLSQLIILKINSHANQFLRAWDL